MRTRIATCPVTCRTSSNLPKFESFGLVNDSERILLMIDEAHRSQSGDLGDNLFEAFPQRNSAGFHRHAPDRGRRTERSTSTERFGSTSTSTGCKTRSMTA
jgi:type I restriction enzyme R subunit